jgi:hypothetical protein
LSGSRVLPCVNYSIKVLVPRVVLFLFFVIVFIPKYHIYILIFKNNCFYNVFGRIIIRDLVKSIHLRIICFMFSVLLLGLEQSFGFTLIIILVKDFVYYKWLKHV